MGTITIIGDAISVILSVWKSGETLLENIANVIVGLFSQSAIAGLFSNAALKIITKVETSYTNFQNGQAAVVDSVIDTPFGEASLLLVLNNGVVGQELGLGGNPPTPPSVTINGVTYKAVTPEG